MVLLDLYQSRDAQWSWDSLRDFKVVAGKVVEWEDTGEGDLDSEEPGNDV